MGEEIVNLDRIDIDNLPERKAVYAIFARDKDTGEPINCRYVGETDNLKERTKAHFQVDELNSCLKEFMQSIKTKLLLYELMPNSLKDDRLGKEKRWVGKYNE